ncbi:RHS repeat-associated core domain-containing protein, partial [Oceanobacter mangrovi]|uniref:RHS repeat-associated core domain-containing protein n=1 Tax=Oceanobacter mangrovi TaxID=2862510 RepID=UPI001C8EF276
GNITDQYQYEAFGSLLNQTGDSDNYYLYTGEQYDENLDQYYLRARYYDQGVGRFTQMDEFVGLPLEPVTLNKYLYGNADPVNMVDPSGYLSLGELSVTINNIGRNTATAGRLFAQGASRQGGKLLNRIGKDSEKVVE